MISVYIYIHETISYIADAGLRSYLRKRIWNDFQSVILPPQIAQNNTILTLEMVVLAGRRGEMNRVGVGTPPPLESVEMLLGLCLGPLGTTVVAVVVLAVAEPPLPLPRPRREEMVVFARACRCWI